MRIITWNVNGIRAVHKKGLFVPFIQKLKPDILCLQETKAEKGQAEIDLPEYEEYWNSSSGKKGYAGTAIFTKIKPKSIFLDIPDDIIQKFNLNSDSFGHPNKEGRVVAAEFEKFFLVNVYTPNAKPDLARLSLRHDTWDPAFLAYCKKLEKEKPVIFCGDLNVAHTPDDLANPKANEGEHGYTVEERAGIDAMVDAGFVDAFRLFKKGNGHYTWWSHFANARARNVGWRIDYFFVSENLKKRITASSIHPDILGSDHCPVVLDISL
ncbi:exodeoxyribonuclease III [Candidatus Kaiserbacteria bacterium RIFCSPHIGHO2_01_FULL_48_10]|uniref:Exodeoxyribonuclease III n=1 Tax=Candidatus Kaiserbacteria bacterium RIFCSPHIGHO2_01_FULL_48_10 TaxID=1798476 RepID=A0A1F6C3J0_9BACT|nr:MAG: exodeoxyribonuclease III [Candidatus Kaiserbacteria bacterium RIFCSPHIGHO2_01_FULL_48_10]